eukprot:TRINITY_DN12175_c0_g1_i1.p1 TRINITY_DN12175_c0_g1~~TRINITY_DN12175_c0_g1_i1.p1  ORF type:complete len:301 (+),score=51.02 TRINITY_DN12175_c0_g1_i1:1-903(+)
MVIACSNDRWGVQEIFLPNRFDIHVSRGLYGLGISSGYDFQEGVDGQDQDPYCGSDQRPSVFSVYLPVIADQLEIELPPNVCCGPDQMFSATRDDNRNNWCNLRDAIIGTSITATILAGIALLSTSAFCCARGRTHLVPFIFFALLSGALGFSASVIWGVWINRESDDRDDRNIAAEGDWYSAFSMTAFTIGWILTFLGGAAEMFACCSMRNVQAPQMQHMPYVVAYGQVPMYSTHGPGQHPPHPAGYPANQQSPHTVNDAPHPQRQEYPHPPTYATTQQQQQQQQSDQQQRRDVNSLHI